MPPPSSRLAIVAVLLLALGASADPLACQPNDVQPMLPIFHIIGNVTQHDDGTLSVEPINDASGITFYGGLYHLWHQCCQNHWDHVISADLIHWQRLPPPIQPVTLRTWDGSISMVDAAFGGPVILYDAQDGKMPLPADSAILGVARLANLSDPYLMTWTRAENNPVNFTGAPIAFPGQVWRNGDHFNFVGQGSRFTTTDPTFHSWTNMGAFNAQKEHSGQWTVQMPNQIGGAPPPVGAPNMAINVNGGADYELGYYNRESETFVSANVIAHLEGGRADWWGGQGGPDNNGRMMVVGWAEPDFKGPAGPGITFLTRLTLVREVNYDATLQTLVANPLPELVGLRSGVLASERGVALAPGAAPHAVPGTDGGAAASAEVGVSFSGFAPGAVFGACVLSSGGSFGTGLGVAITINSGESQYWLPGVNLPGCDYNVTHAAYTDPLLCQAACTRDSANCSAFSFVPAKKGSTCSLKNCVPLPVDNPEYTSGIVASLAPGSVSVRVGSCAEVAQGRGALRGGAHSFPMLPGESSLSLRVFPDRSVADFFVQGGRWSGTMTWLDAAPRAANDSLVVLWATNSSVAADVDVWSMGCGWLTPSYTDTPTLQPAPAAPGGNSGAGNSDGSLPLIYGGAGLLGLLLASGVFAFARQRIFSASGAASAAGHDDYASLAIN